MSIETIFLQSAITRLGYYKELGDKSFAQLNEEDFHFKPNEESNSIAVIIQHVSGNMLSRFTDLLISDGEKEWRNRDAEFEDQDFNKEKLIALWEQGWKCCNDAITRLSGEDLLKTIYIRSESLSVIDAINRQLAHYPYHVGQVIYMAKIIKNKEWNTLSIARDQSQQFNKQK